jgi:outer membrane protein assembly factor BamB
MFIRLKQLAQDGAFSDQVLIWNGIVWTSSRKNNVAAVTPTVAADNTLGYAPGSLWIDSHSGMNNVYICTDASTGAAIWVRVDEGVVFNNQVGVTYQFALSDIAKMVTFNNALPVLVTVPDDITVPFPVGTQIDCSQAGVGKVTFVGAVGVTIHSKGGNLSIAAQWVGATLIKTATDTWILFGDLIA